MTTDIKSENVDGLVVDGINHIRSFGERINARVGTGLQAYSVNYVLENSHNRIHTLRYPTSLRYLCREFIAYFRGSLNVEEGLSDASIGWRRFADAEGAINSNYGYYVFYQNINNQTQYSWVMSCLQQNLQTRRALININQSSHKRLENKDFPCTIAMQFFVYQGALCCEVSSRSTDVMLGLPYDMGFFSFLTELVFCDLSKRFPHEGLTLGYTMIKTSFTQIYDETARKADDVLTAFSAGLAQSIVMPWIEDASLSLEDIYGGTQKTKVVEWIYHQSQSQGQS